MYAFRWLACPQWCTVITRKIAPDHTIDDEKDHLPPCTSCTLRKMNTQQQRADAQQRDIGDSDHRPVLLPARPGQADYRKDVQKMYGLQKMYILYKRSPITRSTKPHVARRFIWYMDNIDPSPFRPDPGAHHHLRPRSGPAGEQKFR